MNRPAPSAAPPSAIPIWCDSRSIYIELPNRATGLPYVLSFPRNSKGLSDCLHLMFGAAEVAGPATFRPNNRLVKPCGTPAQHALAESLLRKARLL